VGRWRRRREPLRLEPLPDGVPRRGLFAEPLRVATLAHERTETDHDGLVVTFALTLRDAEDRRVPDIAVEALVTTPEREARAVGTTDLMGRLRIRTRGPAGPYRVEVIDVAAGGLDWDPAAGPRAIDHTATSEEGPAGA